MISMKNISNFTLRELTCLPTKENHKILMVKPEKIYLPSFKSSDVIHQVIYVSDYNKDHYFIPL
jgi:hypothetical protein